MAYKEIVYKLADYLTKANLITVAVASIWILSEKEIVMVGPIFAILFLYAFILPVLVFPSKIFTNFMLFFNYKQRDNLEKLMLYLSLSWLNFSFSIWVSVLVMFGINVIAKNNLLAGLLVGASMAMSTLLLWVQQDKDNPFIVSVICMMQVSVIFLVISRIYILENLSFWLIVAFLFVVMSIFSLLTYSLQNKIAVIDSSSDDKISEE